MSHKRRWAVDFNSGPKKQVENPPGFSTTVKTNESGSKSQIESKRDLNKKRSRATALAPGKNIFMTLFMLWMSGNSVNIFSIMITFYTGFGAIKGMLSVNKVFHPFAQQGVEVLQDKLMFFAVQFIILCIALYKCNNLGILPTTTSDFSFRYHPPEALELASL
eukprot:c12340_g2_i1.p1 GENE.c12340_g2_i1~~c12340_g2_i1.p1  ORF type:complete len:180 (+),score=37.13 c12340_g2_i1:53-541(+)